MSSEVSKVTKDQDVDKDKAPRLIVYNDTVNSFENVIESLMEVCEHTYEQSEQCAWIIHNKGKYAVKSGVDHDKLLAMQAALILRGLQAEVE